MTSTKNLPELVGITPRTSRRAAIAAGVGTLIEWYDYSLFGVAAGLVIAPLFFPEATGAAGALAAFATFAVGFLARPIGGIVLGALGDKWGRRPVLVLSVALTGVSTTLIGAIPDFATIGVLAPVLLVILRLTQGFGAGAELAGAITYSNESAIPGRKGFYSSFAPAAGTLGGVLAIGFFTILSGVMGESDFMGWGWRIPFLLSAVFTGIALLLRRRASESPEFERMRRMRVASGDQSSVSALGALGLAFRSSPRNFLASFLVPSGLNVTGFVVSSFGISYLIGTVGVSRTFTLQTMLVMTVAGAVAVVLFGRLADSVGARKVLLVGSNGAIAFVVPYFLLLRTADPIAIMLASIVLYVLGWSAVAAAHVVIMPALFKTEYRSSGLSVSRELQGAMVAGPTPLIAVAQGLSIAAVFVGRAADNVDAMPGGQPVPRAVSARTDA
jgi:MFS transporter, MHS family, shikimate and dehydroshikimate transport protein